MRTFREPYGIMGACLFPEDHMPDTDGPEWPRHLDALVAAPANRLLLFEYDAVRLPGGHCRANPEITGMRRLSPSTDERTGKPAPCRRSERGVPSVGGVVRGFNVIATRESFLACQLRSHTARSALLSRELGRASS